MTADRANWRRQEFRPLRRAYREVAVLIVVIATFLSLLLSFLSDCAALGGRGICGWPPTSWSLLPVLGVMTFATLFLLLIYLVEVKPSLRETDVPQ
jgi:hypothetical protein